MFKKETYITLFSAVPDSYLFKIKRISQEYGYPDSKFPHFKIFNLSIYGNRRFILNNNYFKLYVDWKNKNIILFIYDKNLNIIDKLTHSLICSKKN